MSKDIIEGNKLIAEFMQMKENSLGWEIPGSFQCQWTNCELTDFRFHTSWDWQVPVYSKIMQKVYGLDVSNLLVQMKFKFYFESYGYATEFNDIKHGFDMILKAIRWYNSQPVNK